MRVRFELFSAAREAAGGAEVEVDLPPGATVAEAAAALAAARPGLSALLPSCRFAVGDSYAGPDRRLREGEAVAVVPPVGGG